MGPSGCWKMEIDIPWKVVVDVVNGACNKQSWLLYLVHSWLEILLWISITHWYRTKKPYKAIPLTRVFFLVFEYIISATATGNGDSFVMQCLAFSADPRRSCFTELNLNSGDIFIVTRELSFDILLALPFSIIWIICTRSNGTELLWRLRIRSPSKTSLFRNSCFQRIRAALVIIIPVSFVLLLHASNTALPTSLSSVTRTLRSSFASYRPGTCSNSCSLNLVLWTTLHIFLMVHVSAFGSCTSRWDLVNGILVLFL